MVTPRTSHPNKYWHKNSRKFISLWRAAQDINAILYLVNYAKVGTAHADEVTAIRVHGIDESKGIIKEEKKDFTRLEFAAWFRKLNSECK